MFLFSEEVILPFKSGTSSDRNHLVIHYEADRDSAVRQLLSSQPEAAAGLLPPLPSSAVSSLSGVGSPLVSMLQSIAPFKNLFDELAKVSSKIITIDRQLTL